MQDQYVKKSVVLFLILLFCMTSVNQVFAENVSFTKTSSYQPNHNSQFDIDTLIKCAMKIGRIPSVSACIVQGDSIKWYGRYGLSNIETKTAPTRNTIYIIASISKTVTATAVLQLYEKGMFNLDGDVNSFLDFDLYNPMYPNVTITFRMLLSQSAGLGSEQDYYNMIDYQSDPLPLGSWLEQYFYNANGTMKSSVWTDKKPGEEFFYVNIGFCVLAYIVERITGQSFNEYCRQNIFIPLEMNNTSFLLSEIDQSNMAVPYVMQDRSFKSFLNENYLPLGFYSFRMYPAGNVMTSIEEFSHFLIAHMNNGEYKDKQILNTSTINMMHSIQSPTLFHRVYYGFGFILYPTFDQKIKFYGHGGSLYGYNSQMITRCRDNISIMYFINRNVNEEITGKISHFLIQQSLFLKSIDYTN